MRSPLLLKGTSTRILCVLMLTVLLVACGSSSNRNPGGKASPTPNNGNLSPTRTPVAFDVNGLLHIQSNYPPVCSESPVLAEQRLTYDDVEIQQMAAFADQAYYANEASASFPPLPTTLRLVQAGLPGELFSEAQKKIKYTIRFCEGEMDITNIGQTTVQISQLKVQLTAVPQVNNYHYHLIDICSLPISHKDKCPVIGGAGPVDYRYDFQLKKEEAGTVLPGQLYMQDQPTTVGPTVESHKTVQVVVSFESPGTPANLIYSVTPELVLEVPGEQRTIPLSQLQSTLAYADFSQFSCYQLKGSTFVPLDMKKLPDSSWCV